MAELNITIDTKPAEKELTAFVGFAKLKAQAVQSAFQTALDNIKIPKGFAALMQQFDKMESSANKAAKGLNNVTKTNQHLNTSSQRLMKNLGRLTTEVNAGERSMGSYNKVMQKLYDNQKITQKQWAQVSRGIKENLTNYKQLISQYRKGTIGINRFSDAMGVAWQRGEIPDKVYTGWKQHLGQVETATKYMNKHGVAAKEMGKQASKAWRLNTEETTLLNRALNKHRDNLKNTESAYGKLHTRMKEVNKRGQLMNSMFARFSVYMSGIAASIFVFQNIIRLVSQVVTQFAGFVRTLDNLQQILDLTVQEIQLLGEAAREMGRQTTMSAKNASVALRKYMLEGKSAAEAVKALSDEWQRSQAVDNIESMDDAMKMLKNTIAEINLAFFTENSEAMKQSMMELRGYIQKNQESILEFMDSIAKLTKITAVLLGLFYKMSVVWDKMSKVRFLPFGGVGLSKIAGAASELLDLLNKITHPVDTIKSFFGFDPAKAEAAIQAQEKLNKLKEIQIQLAEQQIRHDIVIAKYAGEAFVKRYNAIDEYVGKWAKAHKDLKLANSKLYKTWLSSAKGTFTQIYDLRISEETKIQNQLEKIMNVEQKKRLSEIIDSIKMNYIERLDQTKKYSKTYQTLLKSMYKDILGSISK